MSFEFSINFVVFVKLIELINTFINFNFFHFVFLISFVHRLLRSFFNFLHSKSTCLIVCLLHMHEHMKFSIFFLLNKNVCRFILIVRSCIAIALSFFESFSCNRSIVVFDFDVILNKFLFLSQFFHFWFHCCLIVLFITILTAFFNICTLVCCALWSIFISFLFLSRFFNFQSVICLIAIFVCSLFSISMWIDIQCNFISMYLIRKSSINQIIHFIKYWSKLIFESCIV